MAEAKGIKEMSELIVGVKDLALTLKAVLKDGKINLQDIGALMTLVQKQSEILAAFEGLAEIPGEAKDLSIDEAYAIVTQFKNAAKEVLAA